MSIFDSIFVPFVRIISTLFISAVFFDFHSLASISTAKMMMNCGCDFPMQGNVRLIVFTLCFKECHHKFGQKMMITSMIYGQLLSATRDSLAK